LLRSIETKPFDSQICPHFWTDILRASQGRFDPSYNSLVCFVWVGSQSVGVSYVDGGLCSFCLSAYLALAGVECVLPVPVDALMCVWLVTVGDWP